MTQLEGTFALWLSSPRWQVLHCATFGSNRSEEEEDFSAAWHEVHFS
jgi:hypothetical protein